MRQLYFGSCEIIKAARGWRNPPTSLFDVIGHLSTMPAWLELWKRSACRAGTMRCLALAKAYHPTLDPSLLAGGFPEFNVDGTKFGKRCYSRVCKQTRYAATQLANAMKLSSFQHGYDEQGEEVIEPNPERCDLLQSYRATMAKDKTAPSSSTPQIVPPAHAPVEDENEEQFESLQQITWKPSAETPEATKTREDDQGTTEGEPAKATEEDPASTEPCDPTGNTEA